MPRSGFQPRRHRRSRVVVALTSVAALVVSLAMAPAAGAVPAVRPAAPTAQPAAAAVDPPTVALVGSLQSELGCPGDWDPACAASELALQPNGLYSTTFSAAVPAGSYEYKVALNDGWDENYGAGGAAGGANLPLVLSAPVALRVTYDHETHLITVAPATPQPSGVTAADKKLATNSLRHDLTRERFYFVMTDRFANADASNDAGGLGSDRLVSGLDPTDKGFYHGGDVKGITSKLNYLKNMGVTAVWMTPSFKNNPVQGAGADVSAGYHGYWITDFTQIDPHLGSNADLKELIDAAHAKGIKVFFDIITNHTADIIDNTDGEYSYVSKEDEPYTDAAGVEFDDAVYAAGDTFPELSAATSFPRPPIFRTVADETAKVPAWLNDPKLYHNRGNANFDGTEGDYYGDFVGLDDLFTEQPTVRDGMIDIYKYWAEFGIDGFRIDTVKHVNMEFWQKFAPAITAAAKAAGKPKFFQFGEVYDSRPAAMSRYTTEGGLQATLDFGFQNAATRFGQGNSTTGLRDLFAGDDYYTDVDSNAYSLPTFLGNHDMGRIGNFLSEDGTVTGDALLRRDLLTQSLMFLTRGQPVTYYGDEQGFVGDGGDKDARQDMFPSQVASYNDDDLIGTDATTAQANFNQSHPVYQRIKELSALRDTYPTLADGAQLHRYASSSAGVYAFSRIDAKDQVEYLVVANNSTTAASASFEVLNDKTTYKGLWPSGTASLKTDSEARVSVTVPPQSVTVWRSTEKLHRSKAAPSVAFRVADGTVGGRAEIGVAVPEGGFNQVTFAWRPAGTTAWTVLGTDDNAPYRVFHDVSDLPKGSLVEYRAVLKDHSGNLSVAGRSGLVGDPPAGGGGPVTGAGIDDGSVVQPDFVSVPGSANSEMGCPGDWQPECAQAQLELRADGAVWSNSYSLPAGAYAYKAAINKAWTENYGANATPGGSDIPLTLGAPTDVTFYYDHRTHWVTNDLEGPIVTAVGSFQGDLLCPDDPNDPEDEGNWKPDCLQSWLQDPDGDGVYTYATSRITAGEYEAKVTHGLSWDENYGADGAAGGDNIPFIVVPESVTTFSYDSETHVLTITNAAGGPPGDLTKAKAQWLTAGTVAIELPDGATSARLHYAAGGGLAVDDEAVTGGSSIPLSIDAGGLSTSLQEDYPHLASYDALELRSSDTRDKRLLRTILSGQVVVAVYDDLGQLLDATGVQLPGVLDDVYRKAQKSTLGPTWKHGTPTLAVWAPTAQSVELLLDPAGAPAERAYRMFLDDDTGVWSLRGNHTWNGAAYAFRVKVYVPATGAVQTNVVTDPYALALTTDSVRSVLVDLDSASLKPAGWDQLTKPNLAQPEDSTIYELHIRDFSIGDTTVPAAHRGGYLAFTDKESVGMKHLKSLALAGLNTVHLLPAFDIATIKENKADQQTPACDLPALTAANPAGEEQQACVTAVADTDGFNWGYDPFHYTVPEGSYATNPDGPSRTLEFRQMVAGLNKTGLRVVMDVVYNHTTASGQDPKSVLDRIVPGYYQRLSATGTVENSTCCANTASEHAMMEKLLIDSVLTWAVDYKVDGFRFDLMGHHSRDTMVKLRGELDKLSVKRDGVDGKKIYLYGEGWNFGEVADNARFRQATQVEMFGAGIGTFNDRLRDSVRGGGPFDDDPRFQGFGSGLYTDPNALADNAGDDALATLRLDEDRIKVGLTGNLRDFRFTSSSGAVVKGSDIDYNGAPTGYTADPSEVITYVDAHDNETLFDALTYKLPVATSMTDRVRMNTLSLATVTLGQGPSFWHAGADLLRSKSLDRNSYNSGDWFNRIDFSGTQSTFGSGLPPETDNSAKWDFMRPLLENASLKPGAADLAAATAGAQALLKIRSSSPLFRLGTAALIQERLSFPGSGPSSTPGVIVMQLDDRIGRDLDRDRERIVVVFNATPTAQTVPLAGAAGLKLHPVQAAGSDATVKQTTVAAGSITVPARTVAVLQG